MMIGCRLAKSLQQCRFDDLRQLVKRHEEAVVWGNSPP